MVARIRKLDIWMNGEYVAQLSKQSSGALELQYAGSWLDHPKGRPLSLSLGLRIEPYRGDVVYNFFDNLLPDNPQIRDRIQSRFEAPTGHPFDLLSVVGADCVGAMQILASELEPPDVRRINAVAVDEKRIGEILKNYRSAPLGMEADEDDFRISIAGAQEKTALLKRGDRWYRPIAATPTSHILKLPIGHIEHSNIELSHSCENEWLSLKIANAVEINTCKAEIESFDGVKALCVERFDRKEANGWIIRLPQEDMCQALGYAPTQKYESDRGPGIPQIMKLLSQSQNAQDDRKQFIKTQLLFWLLAAPDGHAKNFSLFIEAGGRYRMTPLYDILSAHPLMSSRQLEMRKLRMAMSFTGKNRHYRWHEILPRHIVETFVQCNVPQREVTQIMEELMSSIDHVIDAVQSQIPDGFPVEIAEPIFQGIQERKDLYFRLLKY